MRDSFASQSRFDAFASWSRLLVLTISFIGITIICQNDRFLRNQEEAREIREHILKSGQIDKLPGELEKVDESGSLPVKSVGLAGLLGIKITRIF